MQVLKSVSFNPNTVTQFAKLCIVNRELAMNALRNLADPEVLITALVKHPGALEALHRADNCPRTLKLSLEEALEAGGHVILT